jgi:hypothetical protein
VQRRHADRQGRAIGHVPASGQALLSPAVPLLLRYAIGTLTNLDLDPALVERVLALSGEPTKTAAVTKALEEYVARHEQRALLELFGALSWDSDFSYKAERSRR